MEVCTLEEWEEEMDRLNRQYYRRKVYLAVGLVALAYAVRHWMV